MARPLHIQIVERARALISDKAHWCCWHLAENSSGVSVYPASQNVLKRCALGALIAAAYELTHDFDTAWDLAHKALRPHAGAATLIQVNDVRGHGAVLALFDDVIAAEARSG
jgi:hypothetical protein